MKEIILALLRILETLIGKEKEGSNKVLPLLLLIALIGGGAIYFINKESIVVDPQPPEIVDSQPPGDTSSSKEDTDKPSNGNDSDNNKNDNEENIKISKEEFNAKNKYKIIWASNNKRPSVYEELKRMEDIVKPYVGKTSIEEVHTGKYSLIIDYDTGASIESLEKLKNLYNEKLQNIALEPKNGLEYQIGREPVIYIRNEYIDNAILDMKRECNDGNYDKAKEIKQGLKEFILYSEYSDKFKHYEDELNLEIQ